MPWGWKSWTVEQKKAYYRQYKTRKRYREQVWRRNGVDPKFTWEDGIALYALQRGLCGFCGSILLGLDSADTALDHDHVTHKVRSWVHRTCNTALGTIEKRNIRGHHIDAYFTKTNA